MSAPAKVVVHYDGTDLGKIYLRDIGQRNGLGGGKGIFSLGQDRYITHGQDATLVLTSDAAMSETVGVIKKYVDLGSFSTTNVAMVP